MPLGQPPPGLCPQHFLEPGFLSCLTFAVLFEELVATCRPISLPQLQARCYAGSGAERVLVVNRLSFHLESLSCLHALAPPNGLAGVSTFTGKGLSRLLLCLLLLQLLPTRWTELC